MFFNKANNVDEDDDNESSVLDVPPFLRPRKF